MRPLETLLHHNIEVPFPLGEEIGNGVDGQVFLQKGDEEFVIKLSAIIGTSTNVVLEEFDRRCAVIDNMRHFYYSTPIANYFTIPFERCYLWQGNYSSSSRLIYYARMERLLALSADEERVFHTLLSHEDANKKKQYDLMTLNELSNWYSFDQERANTFCKAVFFGRYQHNDLHIRNIMKDADGNYKLIDFDRMEVRQ